MILTSVQAAYVMLAAMGLLTLTLFGVLTAGPTIKLAEVGFSQTGLSNEQAAYYSEHFAVKLAEDPSFRVATSKDMAALLGLERQKALLGCADGASTCMAEIAGAMGVDGLVTGQIARVGQSFQLSVKVLAANGSKLLFVQASELVSSEEKLLGEVTRIAGLAAQRLKEQLLPEEAIVARAVTGSRPLGRLAPTAIGAVALGVGVGLAIDSGGKYAALQRSLDEGTQGPAFPREVSAGRTEQTVGLVVAGLGLAAVVGGVIWYLAGPAAPLVGVYGSASGGGVNVTWELR